MSWYQYIPAALSAVSAISESNQMSEGGEMQSSWMKYDAEQRYGSAMKNIEAQQGIAAANAAGLQAGAKVKGELIVDEAIFNANMIKATTKYNNSLLDYEEELLWEQMDLDIELLERQRARERGTMKATQSASGTVMGEGSNAEVIIDQRTQEALDAFVVRRNADIEAKKIANKQAQNTWQGEMAIQKTLYQGQLQNFSVHQSAGNQAAGILAQSGISAAANKISAGYARDAGFRGGYNTEQTSKSQSWNRFTQGMFGAAASAASTYYSNKDTSTAGSSLMDT